MIGVLPRGLTEGARAWSFAALLAGVIAAGCATVLIAAQPDPSSLNWPLIVVPLVAVPVPVLAPRPDVRWAAAIVMGAWCWLTGFSLGLFFIPCLLLMIGAARTVDE